MNSTNNLQSAQQVDLYTRFTKLPSDLQVYTLSFLPKSSLLQVSESNKHLCSLASKPILWTRYFQADFPDYQFEKESGTRSHYSSVKVIQINQETQKWISRLRLTNNSPIPPASNPQEYYRHLVERLSQIYQDIGFHTVLVLEPRKTILKAHFAALKSCLFGLLKVEPRLNLTSQVGEIQSKIDTGIPLLVRALANTDQSLALILNGRSISGETLQHICKLVEQGKVYELDLSDCDLNDKQADLIAKSVSAATSQVFKITLNRNQITDIGAECFACCLQGDKTIRLELNANSISPQKAEKLKQMADHSLALSSVDVSSLS